MIYDIIIGKYHQVIWYCLFLLLESFIKSRENFVISRIGESSVIKTGKPAILEASSWSDFFAHICAQAALPEIKTKHKTNYQK